MAGDVALVAIVCLITGIVIGIKVGLDNPEMWKPLIDGLFKKKKEDKKVGK